MAVALTAGAAVAATGTAAWTLHDRIAEQTELSCDNTDHATSEDDAWAVSGLTPPTRAALTAAQAAAARVGVTLTVNSGYRSDAYQQRVYDCWVKQTGSVREARLHALPPNESAHVQGIALDIAPPSSAEWLARTHGGYGLCRRYANEPWHFEYQVSYKKGCPALLSHP
ncbi:M15 family metallopeptidase [Catenulispora yoronensis]|uniref:M15 family metallopeptidase n=2 Tax=Catenulispora yoronensis TaxID=450799 RepID=A0ABN2VPY7_9ACTN